MNLWGVCKRTAPINRLLNHTKNVIMIARLIRYLSALFSAYSFYRNPIFFFATILAMVVIPYLAYILFGVFALLLLAGVGVYAIYRRLIDKNSTSGIKW